jgi:hypothetical protein
VQAIRFANKHQSKTIMKTKGLILILAIISSQLVQARDSAPNLLTSSQGPYQYTSIQGPYQLTSSQGPYQIQQPAPLGTSVQYPYELKSPKPLPAPYCPRVADFTDEELLQLLATGTLSDD